MTRAASTSLASACRSFGGSAERSAVEVHRREARRHPLQLRGVGAGVGAAAFSSAGAALDRSIAPSRGSRVLDLGMPPSLPQPAPASQRRVWADSLFSTSRQAWLWEEHWRVPSAPGGLRVPPRPTPSGKPDTFQAEVKQVLSLVINSLYSQQGDLPPRAGLERVRRARQAALPRAHRAARCSRDEPALAIRLSADAEKRDARRSRTPASA